MTAGRTRIIITIACWLAAFGAALLLDRSVAEWVAPIARTVKHSPVADVVKLPGWFPCTVAIVVALTLAHPLRWRAGGLLLVTGMFSGLMYALSKWVVGRVRPIVRIAPFEFDPFFNGWTGLFHAHNLSFPSGHTTLAFASAATLAHLLPQYRWFFRAIAVVVAVERVVEEAHYLSDVVAAAAYGVVAFHVTLRVLRRIVPPAHATPEAAPSQEGAAPALH